MDLACPACRAPFQLGAPCPACLNEIPLLGKVFDVLGARERDQGSEAVSAFYDARPFPGYAPGDDATSLIDRCRSSPFLLGLDRALPADASLLECGCGTAQLSSFLALASPHRRVFGIDACRASLREADTFRQRVGIPNLELLRADLFDLPFPEQSFDFVLSRGVVHHTPDAYGAIAEVAARVRVGGFLVLGWYESMARLFHRGRQGLHHVLGRPVGVLDPLLRRRDLDVEKKKTWIEDQYHHPLERLLPLPRVVRALEQQGFAWVRSIPPAPGGDGIFRSTPKPGVLGTVGLRLGWVLRGLVDEDAGLVSCVMVRQSAGDDGRS